MSVNSPARLATRKLGRAGVEVTELGLGTAPLGENWDIIEEEEASALLCAAWDGGVRYFDTSPWYSTPRPGMARVRPSIGSGARSIAVRATSSRYRARSAGCFAVR